jgi:hypothetical protein
MTGQKGASFQRYVCVYQDIGRTPRVITTSSNVCFESQEQFFSYLATLTITGERAANLDLCLALTTFSSEGSFTCHTYCDTEPPFLRSYPKNPLFSLLNAVLLAKEQSLPILNVLGLTRPARAGFELTTSRLLSESTTTRLRQAVVLNQEAAQPLCASHKNILFKTSNLSLKESIAVKHEHNFHFQKKKIIMVQ